MDQGLVADGRLRKSERDRAALWRLRETLPEAHRLDGATIANDISVPSRASANFSPRPMRPSAPHCPLRAPSPSPRRRRQSALRHQGARQRRCSLGRARRARVDRGRADREAERLISAEHGLGLAKNESITRYKSAAELDPHARAKNAPSTQQHSHRENVPPD